MSLMPQFDHNSNRLSIHHIGGRDGFQPFPRLERFEEDTVNVLYDADTECIPQIRYRIGDRKSELHILPYCFAGTSGPTVLNLNYDQSTSSLLDGNPEYDAFYSGGPTFDWIVSETFKPMERRQVTAITLDDLFAGSENQFQPPDFLSLDTQGSEYDILQGGKETLGRHVIALNLEVVFHQLYKGQKIFGQVSEFLSAQGFQFVRFSRDLAEMNPFLGDVGLRALGFHTETDALFLRKIDNICGDNQLNQRLMLRKLAFLSIVFNQFEYGVECLRRSDTLDDGKATENPGNVLTYEGFLSELQESIKGHQASSRPTFASTKSYQTVKDSFSRTLPPPAPKHGPKKLLRSVPFLYVPVRGFRNRFRSTFRSARQSSIHFKQSMVNTPVERLLDRYGLKEQSKLLKRRRIAHLKFL